MLTRRSMRRPPCRPHLLASGLLIGALLGGLSNTASAADNYHFDLPAQTLRASLDAFSRITGVEVRLSDPALGQKPALPLRGDLAPDAALARLLSSSGLAYAFSGDTLVTVGAAAAAEPGTRLLAPVRIQASDDAAAAASGGANGSTDPTATEGTHSLTSKLLTIGSKTPLAIKDTVQSVSVVTRQQIEDQHLDTLADVMAQMPGITNTQTDNISPTFYSRGFVIKNFQIDGGAPLSIGDNNYTSNFVPLFDTSIYDHVELLRGAAGDFNGTGDPGGVVSLERKRPLDHTQVVIDAELASFNKRRVSIDGSVPLTEDGRFAVRGVLTRDTHDFFYDTASSKSTVGYVNAQAKLLPGTTVNIGGSISDTDTVPWYNGLPRATDGSVLSLPRSFCLCTPGSSVKIDSREWFAQLQQKIGADWSLKANFTDNHQRQVADYTGFIGSFNGIDASTGDGLTPLGARSRTQTHQRVLDLVLSGEFELFGRRHQLTLGANTQRSDSKTPGGASNGNYYAAFANQAPSIYGLDTAAFAPIPDAALEGGTSTNPVFEQRQSAFYVNSRWRLTDPLSLTLGWRYATYHTDKESTYSYTDVVSKLDFAEHTHLPPTIGLSYALSREMTAYVSRAGIYQSQALDVGTPGGAGLPPVTGTNLEFGLKRSDFDGTLNSAVSVYRIVQNNLATQYSFDAVGTGSGNGFPDANGVTCCFFISGNQEKSKGVDLELSGALTPRWQATASYTFNLRSSKFGTETGTPSTGYSTTFVPKHLFKLWTTYQLAGNDLLQRTQIGLGLRGQDRTRVDGAIYDADFHSTPYSFAQGGYAVADVMARYRIARGAELQFAVNNLFDRSYFATVGGLSSGNWYGTPRNYSLALRWSL